MHHASLIQPPPQGFFRSLVYDMPRLHEEAIRQFFAARGNGYWNESWTRTAFRGVLWSDPKKSWQDITPEEREHAAELRVHAHNKCLRYQATYQENVRLLHSFGNWCQEKGIELIFLVFPVSKSYDRYLDPRFKEMYYATLQQFSFPFQFLDLMVQVEGATDEDFNDTDHLNDIGAERLTKALLSVLPETVS